MLPVEAAYALWAPTYADQAHNPLMRAEEAAMRPLLPPLEEARVLDMACGTGRWGRIAGEMGAQQIVGFDASLPMLRRASLSLRAQATLTALPVPRETFDIALCGLAIGHLPDLKRMMREVSRVLAPEGTLLLSHFHPAGHEAGWQRAFNGPDGRRVAVKHHPHSLWAIGAACAANGLAIDAVAEPRVGYEITESFPGSDDLYARYHGLPALLIVRAQMTG
jgi:malonyl-CoA O-methyltransferase